MARSGDGCAMTDDESQDIEERRQQLADSGSGKPRIRPRPPAARKAFNEAHPPESVVGSLTRSPDCHGKESDAVGLYRRHCGEVRGQRGQVCGATPDARRTGSLGARSSTLPSSAHF